MLAGRRPPSSSSSVEVGGRVRTDADLEQRAKRSTRGFGCRFRISSRFFDCSPQWRCAPSDFSIGGVELKRRNHVRPMCQRGVDHRPNLTQLSNVDQNRIGDIVRNDHRLLALLVTLLRIDVVIDRRELIVSQTQGAKRQS